jgi:predicted Zn-dependent peptidase
VRLIPLMMTAALCAANAPAADEAIHIPFEKYKLPNGMRVVLARDTAVPVVAIYMVYDVGARAEEKGHTGLAHLFEHMMFEGSANIGKGEHFRYIAANGGETNGSTHLDYTDFFDTLPSSRLALGLWLESDRMRSLTITEENLKTQKEAVRQERRRNYDSQPYRTIYAEQWPALIFGNFNNTHAGLGSFEDLNRAGVDEVAQFFKTWYAPNNAVLAISGDFETAAVKKLVSDYFGDIAAQPQPKRPDLTEAPRTEGRTATVRDANARVPAVVMGWPAPPRHSTDWYALNVLDAVLTSGESARLKLDMVKGSQSLLQADSGVGWPTATAVDFKEPACYAAILIHKPTFTGVETIDKFQSEIDHIVRDGVGTSELERVKAVMRFQKANSMQTVLSRARLLGIYELMDGDAGFADRDYANLFAVTSEQIQAAAKKYLPAARRDALIVEQGAKQ